MTQDNNLTTHSFNNGSLVKRMLQGAVIALILISIFLITAGEPDPAWPKLWMLRPLIIVPLAGAMGGVFYYLMDRFRDQGRWKTILVNILSLIGYLFVLWIGTVLGLDGTMWN
jgi:hypothetical protein